MVFADVRMISRESARPASRAAFFRSRAARIFSVNASKAGMVARSSKQSALLQAHPAPVADHQVVEEIDADHATGVAQARGDLDVLGTGRRIARRMVVDDDHG